MSKPPVARELRTAEDPSFSQAMELYVKSFPNEDERIPISRIRTLIDPLRQRPPGLGTRYHLYIAESADAVVGMAAFAYYPGPELGFLAYIAVAPEVRCQGLGSRLFELALKQCEVDADCMSRRLRALCLEVERIDLSETAHERTTRQGRLAFFETLGAMCVTPAYVQPSLTLEGSPVRLNLMAVIKDKSFELSALARDFCCHCMLYRESDDEVREAVSAVGQDYR